jgi:hypothetical protein
MYSKMADFRANDIAGYVQIPAGRYAEPVLGIKFDNQGVSTVPVTNLIYRRLRALFGQKATILVINDDNTPTNIIAQLKSLTGFDRPSEIAQYLNDRYRNRLPQPIHHIHITHWESGVWAINQLIEEICMDAIGKIKKEKTIEPS